jgi:hypothetical protein
MSLMLLSAGCEPTSITEARNQLGRGPARTVQFTIPVAQDTVTVGELLCPSSSTTPCDTVTMPGGLIGIAFDPETLTVQVGQQLKFDNLSFSQFTFGYDQMLQTSEQTVADTISVASFLPAPGFRAAGIALAPGVSGDTLRFGTAAGSEVLSATVATGRVVRSLTQNSGCPVTISASLVDSLGNTLVTFPDTVVNDAQVVTDSAGITDSTLVGWVRVVASGDLNGCVPTNPVGFAALALTIRPLTVASVTLRNINETFSEAYSPLAGEPRITAVDTISVLTGSFTVRVQNKLPVQFRAILTLNGVTRGGVTVKDTLIVAAAPGGGLTRTDSLTIDLAGARIIPAAVSTVVEGSATAAQATITSAETAAAVVVSGGGNLEIQRLAGSLDPTQTPELTVSTEEFQEINAADFDLGDLEDALEQATLNDAQIQLVMVNSSGAPLRLSNFTLGVVELTATGQLPRDGLGNIVYQTDTQGAITVAVTDSVARNSTKTLTLQTARLLDRVIDLVLDDQRAAVVGSGSVVVGDGQLSTITDADFVSLRLGLTVALDITIPAAGVTFSQTSAGDGADFGDQDANQIAQRVDTASAIAIVQNGTPFGVQVRIALVTPTGPNADADSVPTAVTADSIFRTTNRVELGPVSLVAAAVDAQGRVTTPVLDTATVSMTGTQSRVLLGKKFWAAVRVTLLPSGTGTRGAIRTTDKVIIRASGSVQIKTGGAP